MSVRTCKTIKICGVMPDNQSTIRFVTIKRCNIFSVSIFILVSILILIFIINCHLTKFWWLRLLRIFYMDVELSLKRTKTKLFVFRKNSKDMLSLILPCYDTHHRRHVARSGAKLWFVVGDKILLLELNTIWLRFIEVQ